MGKGEPWRVLRERDHIELRWVEMPPGVRGAWWREKGRAIIALSHLLDRRERRAVLAHELIHDERQIAYTSRTPAGIVEKEEAIVDRLASEWLVPPDLLAEFVRARLSAHEQVSAADVAEEFDVPQDVAERAIRLAQMEWRAA